jgi:hypothetical protein
VVDGYKASPTGQLGAAGIAGVDAACRGRSQGESGAHPTTSDLEGKGAVTDRFAHRTGPRVRRAGAAALCVLLAVTISACTGDSDPEGRKPQEEPASKGAATTLEPKPVDAKVRVTRVSGRLRPKAREVLADNIRKVVVGYFDDAFLGGDYPRSDFGDAFRTFSREAARQAERNRDLLTNRVLGPTTLEVVPKRQTAYLSVLAPYKVAAGVTARVHLDFLAERGDQPDQRVQVKGRLMLTRKKSGGWQIFGFDLSRSVRTVGKDS